VVARELHGYIFNVLTNEGRKVTTVTKRLPWILVIIQRPHGILCLFLFLNLLINRLCYSVCVAML